MRIMQVKQEMWHNGLNAQSNVAFGYTKSAQTDAFFRQAIAEGKTTQAFLERFNAMCERLKRKDIIVSVQDGSSEGCDLLLTVDYDTLPSITKPFNEGQTKTAFQKMFKYLDDIRNIYRDIDPENIY